jgi:hypothetical protein
MEAEPGLGQLRSEKRRDESDIALRVGRGHRPLVRPEQVDPVPGHARDVVDRERTQERLRSPSPGDDKGEPRLPRKRRAGGFGYRRGEGATGGLGVRENQGLGGYGFDHRFPAERASSSAAFGPQVPDG